MKNRFFKIARAAATEAAKEAAAIHKKYYDTDFEIKTKDAHYDRVTIADVEAEKAIVTVLKEYFPEHNFLGEENHYEKSDSPYTWVIDPLDGTNNFSHKIPIFSSSIALAHNGIPVVGVVYDTLRDEMFSAEKGNGAFLNEKQITISTNSCLKSSILITGFYYSRDEKMVRVLDNIKEFFREGIVGVRRFGSAALDLCYVACGRADGFWEFQLSPWDFAAGMIILQEAGGIVTDLTGKVPGMESSYIVSSNKLIHEKMLEVLTRE